MAIYGLILSMIYFVADAIPINLTNLTTDGIIKAAFNPYYSIFGEFTWGIILGFIGAGIYINERSIGTITIYLILIGIFVSAIFPSHIIALFGILLSLLVAIIFYKAFIERT